MSNLNAAADVQGLLSAIREFIQHPRRLDPLLKDKPGWNVLASAMDVISDTEQAITSYESCDYTDKGMLYLVLYGLLQAIYVQQDGLENLVRTLEGNEQYRIENEIEASFVRRVRHDAIGHPTKQGSTKPKKNGQPGEQITHSIVQHSLRKGGFTLLRSSSLEDTRFCDYQTEELISKNRALTVRVLTRTKKNLEEIEMEHRRKFKGEKLASIFPATMGYSFEKVCAAIHDTSYSNRPFGEISLRCITESFVAFKEALDRRGILNESSDLQCYLDDVEYPLLELGQYFSGSGQLTDPRAASIFARFAHNKMKELLRIAVEIDAEYEEDLAADNSAG